MNIEMKIKPQTAQLEARLKIRLPGGAAGLLNISTGITTTTTYIDQAKK